MSDWLPAVAGIASTFASLLEDTYMYGLWGKDLHRGICFNQLAGRFAPHTSKIIPTWQNIPSWSWAALHKPVLWPNLWCPGAIELCEVKLLSRSTMPALRLEGMLMSLVSNEYNSFYVANARHKRQGTSRNVFRVNFMPDQWLFSIYEDDWTDSYDPDFEGAKARAIDACLATVVFMPVILLKHPQSGFRSRTVVGLLLVTQPDLEHGQYRRAGTAELKLTADEDIEFDTVMDRLRAYSQPLHDPAVHETLSDGRYVVSVV